MSALLEKFSRHREVYESRISPGSTLYVATTKWTNGTPIDPIARERFYSALFKIARKVGVRELIEASGPCPVIVRWNRRGDEFLLRVHSNIIEYLELRHTLRLPFTEDPARPLHALVTVSDKPQWTAPAGVEIPPATLRGPSRRTRSAWPRLANPHRIVTAQRCSTLWRCGARGFEQWWSSSSS
jgi:hypothetical protein